MAEKMGVWLTRTLRSAACRFADKLRSAPEKFFGARKWFDFDPGLVNGAKSARRRTMKKLPFGIAAAAFGAVAQVSGPAAAQSFSSEGVFSTSGRSIWTGGGALGFDTGPQFLGTSWNLGPTFGHIDCFLGACGGVEIGAHTDGQFGVDYSLAVNSGSFGLLYPGQTTIIVPTTIVSGSPDTPGPVTIGTGFQGLSSIQTISRSIPATLQVTGPTVQASLGLDAHFNAFAGAEVCIVACFGPAFGPYTIDKSQQIASINQGNSGRLTVLGTTVSAHQNFSALGGLLNASVNLPNLDGSSATTPGGFGGGVLTSTKRDDIVAVNANLAQIAADAVGLTLSGNVGPFGYNLLQSNAGLALDVEQTLQFTPSASGSLLFSSPVTPDVNGVTSAPTTRIDFHAGDDVTFLPGQVSGLSIQPLVDLHGTVTNTTDLVVVGDLNVQALGLNIAGQSIGPLVNEGLSSADLGHINVFNNLSNPFQEDIGTVMGAPITLDFTCQSTVGNEFHYTDICASSKYVDLGPTITNQDGTHYDLIELASCSDYFLELGNGPNCTRSFAYFLGPYVDGPAGPIFLAGDALGFGFVNPGMSATDGSDDTLLGTLGYHPGLPPFPIPDGAPLEAFAVPEPRSIAILGFALTALLTAAQRRRVRVTQSQTQPRRIAESVAATREAVITAD
jgi:hypothetical protein